MSSRASTFHPPTLDMLDDLGAAEPLIAQGLIAPRFQYRTKRDGLIAQFDFAGIADATAHPFRLQCEQSKLTRILLERLRGNANFEIVFSSAVCGVTQTADGVEVAVMRDGRTETETARWLIGADGARSETRGALGIEFEGFTWPERFLVVSTPFDFHGAIDGSGQRELCRRPAALAFPAADPRRLADHVSDCGGRERRIGALA